MSTQYLDKLGLAHFWSKLKAYFQPILVSGQNIKTINNESLLGSGNITVSGGSSLEIGMTIPYGECSTAADTAAKTVTLSDTVTLDTGLMIAVKFTHYNSASNPTLNVNSLGAISIMRYGETAPLTASTTSWQAGSVILLMYDGTYWQMCDWTNTNTTYSSMSTTEMKNGTATTARTITAARLKEAVLYYRGGTATPTANSISKFDSDAHMNSTDMSAQEVSDFIDSLETSGGQSLQLQTYTLTGTTNSQGAIRLTGLASEDVNVITVAVTNGANYFGIPFKYNNAEWYAKVVDWQSLSSINNTSVALQIWYLV